MPLAKHLSLQASQNPILDQQREFYSLTVVEAVSTVVQARVQEWANDDKWSAELVTPQAQNALIFRLTRDVLHRVGNALLHMIEKDAEAQSFASLKQDVDEECNTFVDAACVGWLQDRKQFASMATSPGARVFQQFDNERLLSDHMGLLQQRASEKYPDHMRDIYERVRTATYRPMQVSDVPAVVSSYRSALLTAADLTLLQTPESGDMEDITKQLGHFRQKLRKGVFIWDLDEQELVEELSASNVTKNLSLRGRVLESEGSILAWLTYKNMHVRPSKTATSHVRSYFRRGVTGKLQYFPAFSREELLEEAGSGHIELLQDVRSLSPYAADRLGAFYFEERQIENPHLQKVSAYRLLDMDIHPLLPLFPKNKKMRLLPNENDKSYHKFRKWGFKHVAVDYNPEGAASSRSGVQGHTYDIVPYWEVMIANLEEAVAGSRRSWRDIQISQGDLSTDHPALP